MSETQNIFQKKMRIIAIEEKGIITTNKKTFERIMMAITVTEEIEITTDKIEVMIEDMIIENMIVDIEGINLIIIGMKEKKGKNEDKNLPHLHK